MKRYSMVDSFTGTFNTGTYRKIPFNIPFDGKCVLDIQKLFIDFHYVATSGSISFFLGLSYKNSRAMIEQAYTSNQTMAAFKDWISFRGYRYSAPGESLQEEIEILYTPKPYSIWCSPTIFVGVSNLTGTITPAAIYADILGTMRKPTEEEWQRLQVEQKQGEST